MDRLIFLFRESSTKISLSFFRREELLNFFYLKIWQADKREEKVI